VQLIYVRMAACVSQDLHFQRWFTEKMSFIGVIMNRVNDRLTWMTIEYLCSPCKDHLGLEKHIKSGVQNYSCYK